MTLDGSLNSVYDKFLHGKLIVASGGMDPLHVGHLEYLEKAKALGGYLLVIINNDNWIKLKKGKVFMPQHERVKIVKALRCVDDVILSFHEPNTKDLSICKELEILRPDIFAKGGDRISSNIPEKAICDKLGIKIVDGLGAKIQSSSWLIKNAKKSK